GFRGTSGSRAHVADRLREPVQGGPPSGCRRRHFQLAALHRVLDGLLDGALGGRIEGSHELPLTGAHLARGVAHLVGHVEQRDPCVPLRLGVVPHPVHGVQGHGVVLRLERIIGGLQLCCWSGPVTRPAGRGHAASAVCGCGSACRSMSSPVMAATRAATMTSARWGVTGLPYCRTRSRLLPRTMSSSAKLMARPISWGSSIRKRTSLMSTWPCTRAYRSRVDRVPTGSRTVRAVPVP